MRERHVHADDVRFATELLTSETKEYEMFTYFSPLARRLNGKAGIVSRNGTVAPSVAGRLP